MNLKLWNFLDAKGSNVVCEWGRQQTKRDQAKLDQKFDRLQQIDFDLAKGTSLLAGPIAKQKHIYKLVIHGDVQLRPMLCKGPHDMDSEYTLLIGGQEKNFKLSPSPEKAEQHRQELIADISRRCHHERIRIKA